MLIVGESINTTRKGVDQAVEKRDAAFIRDDVKAQVKLLPYVWTKEGPPRTRTKFSKMGEGAKTICGLSNISFALPKRPLINRTFFPLLMKAGLSVALMDPLDRKLMATVKTTKLLLGQDKHCREYLRSYREGTLDI